MRALLAAGLRLRQAKRPRRAGRSRLVPPVGVTFTEHQEPAQRLLATALDDSGAVVVVIEGNAGSGKRTVLAGTAAGLGRQVVCADLRRVDRTFAAAEAVFCGLARERALSTHRSRYRPCGGTPSARRPRPKWVGETEKQLAMLFDAAAAGHVMLLFDEADALFAKRSTDVRTATDRYANLEVNYLLQRIESFGGVSILTTNLEANLDEALRRRLSAHIVFYAPDEDERIELWSRLLVPGAPQANDIDVVALARDFSELSGWPHQERGGCRRIHGRRRWTSDLPGRPRRGGARRVRGTGPRARAQPLSAQAMAEVGQ